MRRRDAGQALLAGGLIASLGLAGTAILGLAPFAPFWTFLACTAAMAGLALRQPDIPEGEPGGGDQRRAAGPDGALSDGGGTGAGNGGAGNGGAGDGGAGDGGAGS